MKKALNFIAQVVIGTTKGSIELGLAATGLASEVLIVASSGCALASDRTRRSLVPNHPENDLSENLSFSGHLREAHDTMYDLSKVFDGRLKAGELFEGILTKAEAQF